MPTFELRLSLLPLPSNRACTLCNAFCVKGSRAADWQAEVGEYPTEYLCHTHLPLYVERVRDNLLAGHI